MYTLYGIKNIYSMLPESAVLSGMLSMPKNLIFQFTFCLGTSLKETLHIT